MMSEIYNPDTITQLVTAGRLAFHEAIYEQVTARAREHRYAFRSVLCVAMGGSIKDVLLNIPIADDATIFVIDDGAFLDCGVYHVESNRYSYLGLYKDQGDTRTLFVSNSAMDAFERRGVGRLTMIMWELDAMGYQIQRRTVVETSDNEHLVHLDYRTHSNLLRRITIAHFRGYTKDFVGSGCALESLITILGIDAVIDKASYGAYLIAEFGAFVVKNLREHGFILAGDTNFINVNADAASSTYEESRVAAIHVQLLSERMKLQVIPPSEQVQRAIALDQWFSYMAQPGKTQNRVPLCILEKQLLSV